MPAVVTDSAKFFLVANPVPGMKHAPATFVDIPRIFYTLSRISKRPNLHCNYPAPPPEFQLFVFMLRRHFNFKLYTGTFGYDWLERGYLADLESGAMFFAPYAALLEKYRPPELDYMVPYW
jgi:hypothetical protein